MVLLMSPYVLPRRNVCTGLEKLVGVISSRARLSLLGTIDLAPLTTVGNLVRLVLR